MTMPLDIEIQELTQEQAQEIWKEQEARPANYAAILMYVEGKALGVEGAFTLTVNKTNNAEHAKALRKWFGVAGRERKRYENGQTAPAPVVIKWKEDSRKEKRTVTQDGKSAEIEVKVIDKLQGMLIAATDAPQRGRGSADSEQVDALVAAMTIDAGSKKVTLPDGREATLTRSGHWRAPKLPSSADAATGSTDSSTDGASTDNGSAPNGTVDKPTEQPAEQPATPAARRR